MTPVNCNDLISVRKIVADSADSKKIAVIGQMVDRLYAELKLAKVERDFYKRRFEKGKEEIKQLKRQLKQ